MTIGKSKYHIHILSQYQFDIEDDNIDVEVRSDTGERYVATFFTLKNIQRLMTQYKATGECKGGIYFWASDMIIVEDLTESSLYNAIEDLLETGCFMQAFSGSFEHGE